MGQGAQLRAARAAQRAVPEFLRRLDALHACAPRDAHGALQFPASLLGTVGALRRLDAGHSGCKRRPFAQGHGPPALLGGWRRHLPPALHHLRPGARAGRRQVDRRRRAAPRPRLRGRTLAGATGPAVPEAGQHQPPAHDQRGAATPARHLQPRPGVHRAQQGCRPLVPADRDLRPARALLQPAGVPRPLSPRVRRAALRLAAVPGSARGRADRQAHPLHVRGVDDLLRPAARAGARRFRSPRPVAGHDADREHRSRLPDGRA
jgi:hypothetical protein